MKSKVKEEMKSKITTKSKTTRKATKRLIALLLSVIMVLSGLMPIYGFDGDWLEVDGGSVACFGVVGDAVVAEMDDVLIPNIDATLIPGLDIGSNLDLDIDIDSDLTRNQNAFPPTDTDTTWTLDYAFDMEYLPSITPLMASVWDENGMPLDVSYTSNLAFIWNEYGIPIAVFDQFSPSNFTFFGEQSPFPNHGLVKAFNHDLFNTISAYDSTTIPIHGHITILYTDNSYIGETLPMHQTFSTPGFIQLRSLGSLTNPGYTFVGWRDSNGDIWPNGFQQATPLQMLYT